MIGTFGGSRTNIKSTLENGEPPTSDTAPFNEQMPALADGAVSK